MKSGGAAKSAKPYEFASVVQWNSKESVSKIQIGIFYEIQFERKIFLPSRVCFLKFL